ncbi:hypothetical protein [Croceivirga lutea]|uniref:hypothetical protein n=1 Tax=Croceivirga lutea TaxID=1775167 RepID=UPI00163AF2D0|nr:hypothetical protein [Croceivirga lutea]
MEDLRNSEEFRILVFAILLSITILFYGMFEAYSQDVSEKITETLVAYIPPISNAVAGR